MNNDTPCRVSIEENEYQRKLCDESDPEWWDEEEAMNQYYEEKYG